MTTILFSQCLKFDVDSRNGTKNAQKGFRFLDNCIRIGSSKLSKFQKGYLSSTVNVLKNATKNSPINKRDIFQINFT